MMAADVCNYGSGCAIDFSEPSAYLCVISHRYSDGSEKPIVHASRPLTAAEELLADCKRGTGNCLRSKETPQFVLLSLSYYCLTVNYC